MVPRVRFELTTFPLGGGRSIQLSYRGLFISECSISHIFNNPLLIDECLLHGLKFCLPQKHHIGRAKKLTDALRQFYGSIV